MSNNVMAPNRFALCSQISLLVSIILGISSNLIYGGSGSFVSTGDDPVGEALMFVGRDPVERTLRIVSAVGCIMAFIMCIVGWRETKRFPLFVLPISGFAVVGLLVCLLFILLDLSRSLR